MQCFKLRHQEGSERGILLGALHYESFLRFLVFHHTFRVYLIVWKGLLELVLSSTGIEALGLEEINSRLLHFTKLSKVELTMAFLRSELQTIMVVHDLLVR